MLNALEVLNAPRNERKSMVLTEAGLQNGTELDGIGQAKVISSVINEFVDDYFLLSIDRDKKRNDGSVLLEINQRAAFDQKIDEFTPVAIRELRSAIPDRQELIRSSKNLYEMSGAVKLAFANKATRSLSTTMGLLWENLAGVSPHAINPEIEFDLKIKGIDLIAKNINSGVIEYQQLKTQHNTLTGSQKGRSVSELEIHDNPVFCACFANNSSWTFNHPDIPRVSGAEFWSRIGISYDIVTEKLQNLILALEDEYVSLL